MRLATFATADDVSPRFGILRNDFLVDMRQINGPATVKEALAGGDHWLDELEERLTAAERDEILEPALVHLESCRFYPPIPDPSKFICVGKNYKRHLEELVKAELIDEIPTEPTGFIKLNSVLSGHNQPVARPAGIVQFDYEPELAFVIGRRGTEVPKSDAMSYIAGISVMNDLTAREVQRREQRSGTRFWTAKNMPGFGPIGPYIITMDEVGNLDELWLTCSVNGEERIRFCTNDMIFKPADIIQHFSQYLPIEIGDTFSTGAPGGVALASNNAEDLFLKPGDVVDVCIESLLRLTTRVI
jgi:2-keto-4-pentenoate hydratase/2-oxohepta-3-ene-1,7-dioic acid hydratase in catechol pathway